MLCCAGPTDSDLNLTNISIMLSHVSASTTYYMLAQLAGYQLCLAQRYGVIVKRGLKIEQKSKIVHGNH